VADKFGDVFALPLLPETDSARGDAPSVASLRSPKPSQPYVPEADRSTVHSKKNRQALENQLRFAQSNQAHNRKDTSQYTPILGHVSMLTAMATAQDEQGRPYIITADRDEHIRVSRGLPQAHVIETYCLGHKHFVSRLCVPTTRPDILISGGGDNELFVWNWKAGRLLSTFDLLHHVKEVEPVATSIAVSKIFAGSIASTDGAVPSSTTTLLILAERYVNGQPSQHHFTNSIANLLTRHSVRAIIVLQLAEDGQLALSQVVRTPAISLDITGWTAPGKDEQYVIALDRYASEDLASAQASFEPGLALLTPDNENTTAEFRLEPLRLQMGGVDRDGELWSREEIDSHLYTVEKLRKNATEEAQDAET
jgi:hypothetical protein